MSRSINWEKAKRQAKARSDYSPISSFRPVIYRKRKHRHKRVTGNYQPPQPKQKQLPPDLTKMLHIDLPEGPVRAIFRRTDGVWHCVGASSPVEWMTRIRHVDVIHQWLFAQKHTFRWENSHNSDMSCGEKSASAA